MPTTEVNDYPQGNPIRQIALFVLAEKHNKIKGEVREHVCDLVLDLIGCAIAGLDDDAAAPLRKAVADLRPSGDVPIWFTGQTSSLIGAAEANSAAGVALDLDDVDPAATSHWGAAAIATALAIPATPERRLTAIAIGLVVGSFAGGAAVRMKYVNAGVIVPYVAAAVQGALLNTRQEELEHALAIAGEWAPSQRFMGRRSNRPKPDLGLVKEGIPAGVVAGLEAGVRASKGLTGSRNILDDLEYFNFDGLNLEIDNVFKTCFKRYACCRHIHCCLDATEHLLDEHKFVAKDIANIRVETNRFGFTLPNKPEPSNLAEIVYSIPYCIALRIIDGLDGLVPLVPEDALAERDDLVALAKKVTVIHDEAMVERDPDTGDTMARVTIELVDGKTFRSDITAPRGGGPRPFSRKDVKDKFIMATRYRASAEQQNEMIAAVDELRSGEDEALLKRLQDMRFEEDA